MNQIVVQGTVQRVADYIQAEMLELKSTKRATTLSCVFFSVKKFFYRQVHYNALYMVIGWKMPSIRF